MGNPARHITPSRHTLRGDQIGDVIKGDNVPLKPAFIRPPRGKTHQKIFLLPAPYHFDFLLGYLLAAVSHFFKETGEFWDRHGQGRRAMGAVPMQQSLRRAVGEGDLTVIVQTHNA